MNVSKAQWEQMPHISASEFDHPDKMEPNLFYALGELRNEILRTPMYFTKVNGIARHPEGDGVPPSSSSHSKASFHKFGIDHNASYKYRKTIHQAGAPFYAVDFDFGAVSMEQLAELTFELMRFAPIRGLGVYPYWNTPGFHIDTGIADHRPYHWLRDEAGTYHKLTWKVFKEHFA